MAKSMTTLVVQLVQRVRDYARRRGILATIGTGVQVIFYTVVGWFGGESTAALARASSVYWNKGDQFGVDLKDYSHWEGYGPFQDGKRWDLLGRLHFEMFERLADFANVQRPIQDLIEWGCGGGMNAVHFVNEAKCFYGVEISQANLDECARQMRKRDFKDFIPVLIDAEKPEQALERIKAPCQLFLCTYVFQSLPSVDYANRVTELAYEMLAPGGLAMIQIRFGDGPGTGRSRKANYRRYAVAFTAYPIHEYWQVAERIGFKPLYVSLLPPGEAKYPHTSSSFAYFFLQKPLLA